MARSKPGGSLAQSLAGALGAEIVGQLPEVGGGAFGAARLAGIVAELKRDLRPGTGRRLGRPSKPEWQRHPKVSMSEETHRKLRQLAEQASGSGRKVSPMQVAARLLEESLARTAGG